MEIKINEKEAQHLITAVEEMCYGCDKYESGWSGCEVCDWNLIRRKIQQHHLELYTERKRDESK
jgi:hypothetical protein